MGDEQKPLESQEELNAEKEMAVEKSDDDLRLKIAEEEGLDPESDADLLERIVKREKAHRKMLSKTIGQKAKYREQLFSKGKSEEKPQHSKNEPDIQHLVSEQVKAVLEARDIESLNLAEELQEEIKRLAKIEGISVREAAKHPYFVFKKSEFERSERIKNASPGQTSGSRYSHDPEKPLNVSDFDLSTEEGRKAWNAAKAARNKK